MPSRRPMGWIVVGLVLLDLGAALFAYPWFVAAVVGVPFGGPEPWAFLVVGTVAGLAVLANVGIWIAASGGPRHGW